MTVWLDHWNFSLKVARQSDITIIQLPLNLRRWNLGLIPNHLHRRRCNHPEEEKKVDSVGKSEAQSHWKSYVGRMTLDEPPKGIIQRVSTSQKDSRTKQHEPWVFKIRGYGDIYAKEHFQTTRVPHNDEYALEEDH